MASAVYDHCIIHLGVDPINWSAGQQASILATLLGNTAPTKTHEHYSDIVGQIANGNGYTTGGQAFPSLTTVALASNVANFGGGDNTWTGLTASVYYMVVNHGALATAGNALISYHDLGGQQLLTNGTLILHWPTGVVWYITVTPQS